MSTIYGSLLRWVFFGLSAVGALAPLLDRALSSRPAEAPSSVDLTPWPVEIEGRALRPLPLNKRDTDFALGFPGNIQEFTDGRRDYILRYVNTPTRMLHSSADCLRGSGFTIAPQPVWREASGVQWTSFIATRGKKRLRVRERISDSVGNGWTDVSSWYWNALLKKTCAPWLAVTIVETE